MPSIPRVCGEEKASHQHHTAHDTQRNNRSPATTRPPACQTFPFLPECHTSLSPGAVRTVIEIDYRTLHPIAECSMLRRPTPPFSEEARPRITTLHRKYARSHRRRKSRGPKLGLETNTAGTIGLLTADITVRTGQSQRRQ